MNQVAELRTKLFADGADIDGMLEMSRKSYIQGFTTNPTLLHKAGVRDYRAFGRKVLAAIRDRPISFEVFADDFEEMERQALEIASWGENVYVKIPVTNTKREFSGELLRRLSARGVKLNVTALMTVAQVRAVFDAITDVKAAYISVFAGRIADTGRDPLPIMCEALGVIAKHPSVELIWASPRELLNIFQASQIGCHVITVTNDILKKLDNVGKDLDDFSLETVKMFFDDAQKAGLAFPLSETPGASGSRT